MAAPPAPDTHRILKFSGPLTREALHRACLALAEAGPVERLLVDLREVPLPRPDSARIQLACHLVVYFFDARVALLAAKESINHVSEGVAARAGMLVQQFWREEAALAWLLSDAPAAPGGPPTAPG
jgi:hypothetical protein